ncbi:MAG: response regulator [Steroidobacteraceae bacterium]
MLNHAYDSVILLVDDEPMVTEALSRHFAKRRFQVLKATSATEAHRLLEQQVVDVVVSDEQMPGEPGSRFLAAVRQQYPNTIRMILSGQASLEAAVRAINEGEVYRFFLKPCNPVDLIFTIQQALEHRRLEERSRQLLNEFRKQAKILDAIERHNPELLNVEVDETGAIVVDEHDAEEPVQHLLQEIEESMLAQRQRLTRAK